VPKHKQIEGNEVADQLDRKGSSHPLTEPKPALVTPAEVAREVIWYWTSNKHKEHWQSKCEQQSKAFLKNPH
jgi:hypothetical protein